MEILKENVWEEGKYSKQEELAYNEFEKFAPNCQQWFREYNQTKYGKIYDVFALNATAGTEYVELKLRDEGTDKFKDCYIELEKWTALIREWRERNIAPLYVNFIGSYKNVYVWFLPEVVKPNLYIGVPVVSDDGKYEIVDRMGLRWNNAYHFVWNEETQSYDITKPTIKNNVEEKAVQYNG